jgi:hypothetical protein
MLSGSRQNMSLNQVDPPLGSEKTEMILSLLIFPFFRFALVKGNRYR